MNDRVARMTKGAFVAVISFILLFIAAGSPVSKLGITAIAGLLSAYAVINCGIGFSWCAYAVTGILGLLFAHEKSCVLIYIGFLGYYPIVKSLFERISNKTLVWVCKIGLFLAVFNVFWFFAENIIAEFIIFPKNILIFANFLSLIVFIVYDIGISKLISYYIRRLPKKN